MEIISIPRQYMSAFDSPCFEISGVATPLDVVIGSDSETPGRPRPVGSKRIYPASRVSVNAGPYVRQGLVIEPVFGEKTAEKTETGIPTAALTPIAVPKRTLSCLISAGGLNSAAAILTGGTEDAPLGAILSAAPEKVSIRPGETDEIAFITGGSPLMVDLTWETTGGEVTETLTDGLSHHGMIVVPVDADSVAALFETRTGVPADKLQGFRIELRTPDNPDTTRRYTLDRTSTGGKRLAWVNRFGAVDYHTFPVVAESRHSGSRTRIETPAGFRTGATGGGSVERLLSAPCDPSMARWLAEIYSSPAVWVVGYNPQKAAIPGVEKIEKVEVAGGSITATAEKPTRAMVDIAPVRRTVSRRF
jgi:hypothetical protein